MTTDCNVEYFEQVEALIKQRKKDDAAFMEKLDELVRLAHDIQARATRYPAPRESASSSPNSKRVKRDQ